MAKVKIDLRGLEAVATSGGAQALVTAAAEEIADNIRSMGIKVGDHDGGSSEYDLPVKVYSSDTTGMRVDRASARVVLAHAAGLAVQAKHGALTRAASAAGVSVEG